MCCKKVFGGKLKKFMYSSKQIYPKNKYKIKYNL